MNLPEMNFQANGTVYPKKPLAEYTSWRVGGPADYVFIPADLNHLILFLQQIPKDVPLLWLGLGSNVLIRDGGVDGIVIITQGALKVIEQLDTNIVRAEAGVSCAQFARFTARLGMTGVEFMAGIPGTVGGALAMNAGCYGGETWQRISFVETIDQQGIKHIRPAKEFEVGYRHVKKPFPEWFVAGYFELSPGDKKQSLEDIKNLLDKRNSSQPTGLPNCGSVFRNPPNNFAARLIEQCGLKKFAVGGAYVSEKHANFFINDGTATARDVETLILKVQAIVKEKEGVHLIPEVCIIGKPL